MNSLKTLADFKHLKHELIGSCHKQTYFDQGLIESLIPSLSSRGEDEDVLVEIIAILNSFLIQFPPSKDVF